MSKQPPALPYSIVLHLSTVDEHLDNVIDHEWRENCLIVEQRFAPRQTRVRLIGYEAFNTATITRPAVPETLPPMPLCTCDDSPELHSQLGGCMRCFCQANRAMALQKAPEAPSSPVHEAPAAPGDGQQASGAVEVLMSNMRTIVKLCHDSRTVRDFLSLLRDSLQNPMPEKLREQWFKILKEIIE